MPPPLWGHLFLKKNGMDILTDKITVAILVIAYIWWWAQPDGKDK